MVFGASICGGEDHTIRVGRSNKLSYPWVMQLQGTRTAVQAGLKHDFDCGSRMNKRLTRSTAVNKMLNSTS